MDIEFRIWTSMYGKYASQVLKNPSVLIQNLSHANFSEGLHRRGHHLKLQGNIFMFMTCVPCHLMKFISCDEIY